MNAATHYLRDGWRRAQAQWQMQAGDGRIKFIDGLRGVAILCVIMFHAYCGGKDTVPYGDMFAGLWLFKYGFYGVQLFFLISGFVIMLTLRQCRSFGEFIVRRWLRLFPAMLVCTLLVFFTAPLLPERPLGQPVLRDLLPGLTFIQPALWGKILGSPQGVVEGAYWSLYVEAAFYVIFGGLYFIRRSLAVPALITLFLLASGLHGLMAADIVKSGAASSFLVNLSNLLNARYMGWFAAGALYYRAFHDRDRTAGLAATVTGLAAALCSDGPDIYARIAALAPVALFAGALASQRLRQMLSGRFLLFIGFISYPLYLLHENMMLALIVKMGRALPWMPAILLPLAPVAFIICIAALVAVYFEVSVRALLRRLFSRWGVPQRRHGESATSAAGSVSAVIPLYNNQDFITAAVESVLAQSLPVHEVIIVDDGSTDASATVVEELFGADARVMLVRMPHKGRSAARNRGAALAQAEFIAFLDSDDLWHPQKLEAQMATFVANPGLGAVYCDYALVDKAGAPLQDRNHYPPTVRGAVFTKLLRGAAVSGSASAVMVRRTLFAEAGGFDESFDYIEDGDLWLRLARLAPFDYIDRPLTIVRQRPTPAPDARQRLHQFTQRLRMWSKWPGSGHRRCRHFTHHAFWHF